MTYWRRHGGRFWGADRGEDAPLRACRAALAILETLPTVGTDIEAKYGVRPEMRVGINAGSAVVGQLLGGGEDLVSAGRHGQCRGPLAVALGTGSRALERSRV